MRTVHVGIRGRGRWALDLASADARFEPVAVVSRDPDAVRPDAVAAGVAPERVASSLEEALRAAPEADAVVVSTPVEQHARDLRAAFAAGRHVLVEKCLSNRWDEARRLVEEADAAGVRLVVAQNYRYRPESVALAAALATGAYGTPGHVDLNLQKYRPAPRQQDYPCAVFWDQGCHHVDEFQALLGPVTEVEARSFSVPWSRYRDDAAVQVLARFASGATWTALLSNLGRSFVVQTAVHTELGTFVGGSGGWRWSRAAAPEDAAFGWNDPPEELPVPTGAPPTGEHGVLDDFHRAVVDGISTPLDGRANLEVLRVCEMVERSVRQRRAVSRDAVS
jgi:predicted dehydrogenase